MSTAEGPLYEQIIAWVALVVLAPVYLPSYYASYISYPWDYLLLAAEYVEKYTYAIPYWVSQYLAELYGFYKTLLGTYLISLIQEAIVSA